MSGGFFFRAVMARATATSARVLVFIDGQNAYKTCERLYGHGPCHPILLAQQVAEGRRLVGVRYYSGVHDPAINPAMRSRTDRRHKLIRRTGVTVVERQLRYRMEWGFDTTGLPDPEESVGQEIQATLKPYRQPREKGIDLAMGLDVVDLALHGRMDVAVIVSEDNDLCEAARMTHECTRPRRRVSVEAAVFNEGSRPFMLRHYDYTKQLRTEDFEAAKDSFDYERPIEPAWADVFAATCATITRGFEYGS